MKTEFPRKIFETYSNFTKIHPVAVELFHGDGRKDGGKAEGQDEASSWFSRFCESG